MRLPELSIVVPLMRRVTLRTVRSELSPVNVRMTGSALATGFSEHKRRMTTDAGR